MNRNVSDGRPDNNPTSHPNTPPIITSPIHLTVNRNVSDVNFGRAENNGRRNSLGLHMIVTSFDGHIYVIEGRMGCAER